MAILVSEEKEFNWKMVIVFAVVIVLVAVGIYLLFFAPVPGIEIIVPVSVRSASELSGVEFQPEGVVNSEAFRSLRRYTGQPSVGQVGRANPFISF